MIEIRTQEEFNDICESEDISRYFVDWTEEKKVKLTGDKYIYNCRCNNAYKNIIFEGLGKVIIIFENFEKGDTLSENFDMDEVNIYSDTYGIVFKNCRITGQENFELQFTDDEEMEDWSGNIYDTEKISVYNLMQEIDSFLSYIDSYNLDEFNEGDHIVVKRGMYTHHGIFVGGNDLIHYTSGFDISGNIEKVNIEEFARSDWFWKYNHPSPLWNSEIVGRAYSRLGENEYNLVFNNCEHFAHWCSTGMKWSNQVMLGLAVGNWLNSGTKKYKLVR